MLQRLFNILLVFLIVFGFKISFTYNSTVLAVILIIVFRFNKLSSLFQIIKTAYISKTILYLVGIIFLSAFVAIYNFTLEFSIIQSLLNQLFILFSAILFYASLNGKYTTDECHWFLIYAFAIQSVIIIGAYNVPVIADFVRSFQDEKAIILGTQTYGGFRGLALAAAQFFWMSGAYATLFIIVVYKLLSQKNSVFGYGVLILTVLGSFFTGRIVFLGLALSLLLFIPKIDFKQIVKYFILITVLLVVIVIIVPSSFYNSSFAGWLFEFYFKFQETGSLSTSSSDVLFQRMYFIPDFKTILIGDGMWTEPNGDKISYYMRTDSGYMRVLLFYGFTGLIIYYYYAKFTIFYFKRSSLLNNKLGYFFLNILFVSQLLLNVKGQSLGYMTSTQAILFLFFIPYIFSNHIEQKE